MEKTFSKIKTLKSRRKLSLPAAASPLMNNASNSESNTGNDRPQVEQNRFCNLHCVPIGSKWMKMVPKNLIDFAISLTWPTDLCTATENRRLDFFDALRLLN